MQPIDLYNEIGQELEIKYGTTRGQMFGKLCLKYEGKAFAAFFQDEMVFKLTGADHAEALRLTGAQLFDPSGKKRPMKDWVQVPYAHAATWLPYAESALGHCPGKPA